MALPLEKILEGKYEILEKLAEGGVGSLYKVRHRLLEETRVIKVLRTQIRANEGAQKRFLEEAKTAIRLRHPGIAQIFDFAVAEDGTAYIVMEFIEGVALDRALAASGPPSVDLTVAIAEQSLKALDYLHENDFVHRDISPDNVMLTRDHDGALQTKLIDLGIAKNLSDGAALTAVGTFLGKVRYCSPEHFAAQDGKSELDQRSDIYSFGVMLYELLTGVPPIRGDDFTEIAGGHLFKPPIEFAESDPEGRVPEGLRAVVLTALEKDPDKRFASSAEFAERLGEFGGTSANLEVELERILETSLAEAPEGKPYSESGTTQGRIDRHFLPKEPADRKVAHEVRPDRTRKVTQGATQPFETVTPPKPRPGAARKALLWGSIAVVALVALVVLWLSLSPGGKLAELAETTGRPIFVARGVGPAGQSATPDSETRFPTEAPPDDGESLAPADGQATEPPGSSPGQVAGATSKGISPTVREAPRGTPSSAPPTPDPASPGATTGEATTGGGAVRTEAPPARRPPPPPPPTIHRGEMIRPGPATVPPRLLKQPSPRSPKAARKANQAGTVVMEVLVDENGKVIEIRLKSVSPPDLGFEEVALKAARKAKYKPATLRGIEGKMWTELTIEFSP